MPVILGGVQPDVYLKEHPSASARPVTATIVKRRDDKMRLRLSRVCDFAVDDTLLLNGEWQEVAGVVCDVHLGGRLVDVRLRADLDETITRVSVTKFRWGAG